MLRLTTASNDPVAAQREKILGALIEEADADARADLLTALKMLPVPREVSLNELVLALTDLTEEWKERATRVHNPADVYVTDVLVLMNRIIYGEEPAAPEDSPAMSSGGVIRVPALS